MSLTEEEKKERVNVKCNRCSKGIYRPPSKLKRNKLCYCSADCHNLAMRELMTDEERKKARKQAGIKYARSTKGRAKHEETYQKQRPMLLEYKKEWRSKNIDRVRGVEKAYREANRESLASKQRDYFARNKATIAVTQKEYYLKNIVAIKETKKTYRLNNKEKIAASGKRWAMANRDKCLESSRKHRSANIEKIRGDFQEMRDGLHDNYIKRLICDKSNIRCGDIPQSLIEAKRAELKLKRLIREHENG